MAKDNKDIGATKNDIRYYAITLRSTIHFLFGRDEKL